MIRRVNMLYKIKEPEQSEGDYNFKSPLLLPALLDKEGAI